MKKQLSYFFISAVLLLSACLAEQTNPLIIAGGSCTDGIQNNGEEGIDCGGRCTPCEGPAEPEEAPCKASLTDNVITLDDSDFALGPDDYGCTQESEYFKLFIMKNFVEYTIEIYETTLPQIGTRYPLVRWYDAEPGTASIKMTAFYNYLAVEGDLYLSFADDQWIVEVCPTNLIGPEYMYEFSGRILCDW